MGKRCGVKRIDAHQHITLTGNFIDINAPLVDTFRAVAKSAAGIETPFITGAQHALSVFFCVMLCYTHSMVSWARQPSGWPVSCNAGSLNLVQFTAKH
ncbi:ash family protein [Salmonella enterica]|nr:hypothetical protein [Salmonella enterica]EEC3119734.1 hypothetical protein [Salmonella enterica]EGA4600250.1 ash family protein [Salmonella enterica]EGA4665265.1 ash family protein [Salmonella enterica]EIF9752691.1 ash family protein [Salmonella enterica]